MGGLGNQMFQIAHSYCQGLKNNVPSVFLPQSFTPMGKAKQPTHYINNIFRKINFVSKVDNKKIVKEKSWNNPDLKFTWDSNVEFYGYFQSSNNFLGFEKEVVDLFSPTEEFISKLLALNANLDLLSFLKINARKTYLEKFDLRILKSNWPKMYE